MYAEDSDSSWGGHTEDEEEEDSEDDGEAPQLVPEREDLDQIMDDFLSRYEVLGGKIRPVLEPTAGVEGGAGKLDRIRRELAIFEMGDEPVEGEDPVTTARRREKEKILEAVDRQEREYESKGRSEWTGRNRRSDGIARLYSVRHFPLSRGEVLTGWCTGTYSNVSNHPRLLRLRDGTGPRPARITIDPKTGFPVVELSEEAKATALAVAIAEREEQEEEDDSRSSHRLFRRVEADIRARSSS